MSSNPPPQPPPGRGSEFELIRIRTPGPSPSSRVRSNPELEPRGFGIPSSPLRASDFGARRPKVEALFSSAFRRPKAEGRSSFSHFAVRPAKAEGRSTPSHFGSPAGKGGRKRAPVLGLRISACETQPQYCQRGNLNRNSGPKGRISI